MSGFDERRASELESIRRVKPYAHSVIHEGDDYTLWHFPDRPSNYEPYEILLTAQVGNEIGSIRMRLNKQPDEVTLASIADDLRLKLLLNLANQQRPAVAESEGKE